MPLWHVYHPAGCYTAEQKQRFAADVTDFYVRIGLPKFYVMTLFHEIEESSFFGGGEPSNTAVRVVIDHIARHSTDLVVRKQTGDALSRLLAPHTSDRGLYYEFHIDETPQDLWMIDGLYPPPSGSQAEQLWIRENQPVAY